MLPVAFYLLEFKFIYRTIIKQPILEFEGWYLRHGMKPIFVVFRETINFNRKRSKIMINKESLAKFEHKKSLLYFFTHTYNKTSVFAR